MVTRVAFVLALSLATFGSQSFARAQASTHAPTATAPATPAATAPPGTTPAPATPTAAIAQPAASAAHEPTAAELAEARRVFAEGVTHADHGEWEQAVVAFRQVLEVRPAPAVRFNLASALVELGRYAEAEPLLDAVIADPAGGPFVARARALEAEMDQRGGRLRLHVEGATEASVVDVDEVVLERPRLEGPVRVSAGDHVARVREEGATRASAHVTVAPGETKDVVLPILAPVVAAAPVAPAAPVNERPRWVRNKWTWIGVGIGVAAIVTTVVLATTIDGHENAPYEGNATPGVVRF